MEIIVIHKHEIQKEPPLISVVNILSDLGCRVRLVTCGVTVSLRKQLEQKGIIFTVLERCVGARCPIGKVVQYNRFRQGVSRVLREHPNATLWVEGAQTIQALGNLYKERDYVLQIHELHETSKRQLYAIGRVIQQALCVFMPEYSRTSIYQVWFHLKRRPTVLPNKPYFLPSVKELTAIQNKYVSQLKLLQGKKVILYQGHIDPDRDLTAYVEAVSELGKEYVFLLVGSDGGMLKKYQAINPAVMHIDYLPAPEYLLFTSIAHIGILGYSPVSLNNIFCAPNKIFEYAAYGLPVIGNDIPGLYFLINQYKAGAVVNEKDKQSIKQAIICIEADYDKYARGARNLFESVDNPRTIAESLGIGLE